MPTFEYECGKCRRTFEIEQKISDAPLTLCGTRSVEERCRTFDSQCGTDGWVSQRGKEPGFTHPDRCVCQGDDPTPHKHYKDVPFSCARCGSKRCAGYVPALPECDGKLRRLIAGQTGFVLNGKGWFRDGY